MKRTAPFTLLAVLCLTPCVFAAEAGLDRIRVTPVVAPTNPDPVLEVLRALDGVADAEWDSAGMFVASVEDSATLDLRTVRDALLDAEVESADFHLEFIEARAKIEGDQGYLKSPWNGYRYVVAFSPKASQLWHFMGVNPYRWEAPLQIEVGLRWGSTDSTGVTAPDSVEVRHYQMNQERLEERNAARREERRKRFYEEDEDDG